MIVSNGTDNNIRKTKNNQDWQQTNPIPSPEFIANPLKGVYSLKPAQRKVLDYLIGCDLRFKSLYMAQDTIAQHTGLNRCTVNRALQYIKKLGLIASNYHHLKSCDYKLSFIFKDKHVRSALRPLLMSLRYAICVVLFMGNVLGVPDRGTQLKTRDIRIKSLSRYMYRQNSFQNNPYFTQKRLDRLKPMREAMPEVWENNYPITDAIKSIPLDLTKWAQIKLAVFPDEAINEGIERLKVCKRLRDPFMYLLKFCHTYCVDNKLPIMWQMGAQLEAAFGMPENPSYYLDPQIAKEKRERDKALKAFHERKSVSSSQASSSVPRSTPRDNNSKIREYTLQEQAEEQVKLDAIPASHNGKLMRRFMGFSEDFRLTAPKTRTITDDEARGIQRGYFCDIPIPSDDLPFM